MSEAIVVGVHPGQPDAVVEQAARIAHRWGAELVCAWVDRSRYVVEEHPDGSVRSLPTDPDRGDVADPGLPPDLAAQLERILGATGVSWSTRELAGDTGRALGRLAEVVHGAMIVVGTRQPGPRHPLQDFLAGSTAVHLAHRQHRPVVVIPLSPVPLERDLPWELP